MTDKRERGEKGAKGREERGMRMVTEKGEGEGEKERKRGGKEIE